MGDPITWYALSRTVSDPESILEAVDDKLQSHNQDPSAHGQSGEGINAHRTEDILDHPDGCIGLKKIVADKIVKFTDFITFDGFGTGGKYVSSGFMGSTIRAEGGGNHGWCLAESGSLEAYIDYTKNPFFQTTVELGYDTDQTFYMVLGAAAHEVADDSFGFKVVNSTLYAYWTKGGVQHTSEITGVTVTNLNVYRAYCNSDENKIYFYVNGTLKYTATNDYPTDSNSFVIYYDIYTDGVSDRHVELYDLLWMRDR